MNTWNETQEKALMEAVEWVDIKFPGEDGQEIMTAVEKQLKNNQDVTNLVQELNDSCQDFFKNYG